ncbi:MAG: formate dehydrogenase subunit alpha [Dehalococcoidales bacterium]|nr:formate dehydrogenase subunit alpha [Dehalococcoidales bacterium]
MNEISLNIDGRKVTAKPGMTVLEAALENGIYIPYLCYSPDLKPHGGCRLCIVEIEGMEGMPTACTTPVAECMVVRTSTPDIDDVRCNILELILADHPLDCLTCVKNQRCDLQKVAAYLGISERILPHNDRNIPVDDSNPFFKIDRNYCILCQKCTRTCDEITCANAIEVISRGYESRIGTFGDKPIMESNCQSCGECVVSCPTAALTIKESAVPAYEVETTCPYCGVGCGMYLGVRNGKIVAVRGSDSKANSGKLCVKGRFGIAGYVHSEERLRSPLIKKNGKFVEASWDEALSLIAEKLSSYPKEQVGIISSSRCTNEDNYVAQKFCRLVLGTNNIDHCARLCHAPTVAGLAQTFGSGAMTNSIEDISEADCIFAIGSNTTEAHPVIGMNVKQAVRRGTKLIVADPREIDLVRFADIWLRHHPGTDVALLMGMIKVIVDGKLHNIDFIKERCENSEAFMESLKSYDIDFVERITGVPREQVIAAARMYAAGNPSSILYTLGITEHSHGTDNVIAIANLAMVTGNIGKRGSGVNPLRGQNNVQGACDMGALPNVYVGYQSSTSPETKKKFEAAWGGNLSIEKGLTTPEMFNGACDGTFKALYIIGENSVLSQPNSNHVIKALSSLDFLLVQDIFLTETAQLADVVLPAASFAEKDGTFTNTERRFQRVRKAIEPVSGSLADWEITCRIAEAMGGKGFDYENTSQIMDEIAALAPCFGGIKYERLESGGLQWPCPNADHPGTPILHTKQFACGKGKLTPLKYRPSEELPDADYPLILTTGRRLFHYHTGTMTRKTEGLNIFMGRERVQINPADAAKLGLNDDDAIKVISRRGEVEAGVEVTRVVPPGVVYMTFHFAETPTNMITSCAVDPVTQTPEYKVCAVKIEKSVCL